MKAEFIAATAFAALATAAPVCCYIIKTTHDHSLTCSTELGRI
jgi:hypothetical protein